MFLTVTSKGKAPTVRSGAAQSTAQLCYYTVVQKKLIKVALQEGNNKRFHYSSSSLIPPPLHPSHPHPPRKKRIKLKEQQMLFETRMCSEIMCEQWATAESQSRCEKVDSLDRTHTRCVCVYTCVRTHVLECPVTIACDK